MRTLLSFVLLLGLTSPAAAQTITLPDKVTVEQPGLVVLRATALDADDVRWFSVGPGLQSFPPDVIAPKPGVYLGFAMKEGVYKIGVVCAKDVGGKAVLSQPVYVTVTVGNPAPPVPPIPPVPPVPPAPIPDKGVHALIVYDAKTVTALPAAQQGILFGKETRDYLTGKCAQAAGKADWRIWADGLDVSGDPSAPMKAAYARARKSLPWLILSRDGAVGYEGPLPADAPAALALFRKIAEGN